MSGFLDLLKGEYDYWFKTTAVDGRTLLVLVNIDCNNKISMTVRNEEGRHLEKTLTDYELDGCERVAQFVGRSKGLS